LLQRFPKRTNVPVQINHAPHIDGQSTMGVSRETNTERSPWGAKMSDGSSVLRTQDPQGGMKQ
jgi:hypothetical protein